MRRRSDYRFFPFVQRLVFLYHVLVDIDQLKLIMMLVGTPGPELLMKISSESVSSQSNARFFSNPFSALNSPLCCLVELLSNWQHDFHPSALWTWHLLSASLTEWIKWCLLWDHCDTGDWLIECWLSFNWFQCKVLCCFFPLNLTTPPLNPWVTFLLPSLKFAFQHNIVVHLNHTVLGWEAAS